jgi:hypothetical protein
MCGVNEGERNGAKALCVFGGRVPCLCLAFPVLPLVEEIDPHTRAQMDTTDRPTGL